MTWEDIQPDEGREYKAENILNDRFKVFFQSCEEMPEIPNDTVHLWFTSPPYATMRGTMAYPSYVEYLQTMYKILKEMYRTLAPGRVMMINISDYQISEQLDKEVIKGTSFKLGQKFDCPSHFSYLLYKLNKEHATRHELKYEDTLIWRKSGSTSNRAGTFVDSGFPLKYRPNEVTERILVFRKGEYDYDRIWKRAQRSGRYDDMDISTRKKFEQAFAIDYKEERDFLNNVWDIRPETDSDHPAPFPVELPKQAIKLYSLPREIIGDPFLGSATTMRAAMELSGERKALGYENFDAEDEDSASFRDMIKERIGADTAGLSSFM